MIVGDPLQDARAVIAVHAVKTTRRDIQLLGMAALVRQFDCQFTHLAAGCWPPIPTE